MSRTEVLSTCTMQLKSGAFCDAPADERFPNRICASHAIKVFLAVRDQIPGQLAERFDVLTEF